jgi:Phosphotransferase enzyme family
LDGLVDTDALTAVWQAALAAAPAWDGRPVWIHGDLTPGNLLAVDGQLRAVIDFGCLGVGDPAGDLLVAWTWLRADTRAVFRAALSVDAATWTRGRGWGLAMTLPQDHSEALSDFIDIPRPIGQRALPKLVVPIPPSPSGWLIAAVAHRGAGSSGFTVAGVLIRADFQAAGGRRPTTLRLAGACISGVDEERDAVLVE